jgi:hypothetical protein
LFPTSYVFQRTDCTGRGVYAGIENSDMAKGMLTGVHGTVSSNFGAVFVQVSADRKDTDMQTQVTQPHYSWVGRMPRISMALPCVAAMLLTWGQSSIGGTSDIPAPAVLAPILTPAYNANELLPGPGQRSSDANGRLCAGAGGADAGCTANNLVDGAPAGGPSQEWVDVATFVEWHVQARHLAQYDYQTTLTALPGSEAKGDRLTVVSVAAPLWPTFAR